MSEEREGGALPAEGGFDDLDLFDADEPAETDVEEEAPAEGEETPGGPEGPPASPRPQRPGRRERQAAEIRNLRQQNERLERDFAAFKQAQQQPRPAIDPGEQARRDQAEREHVATLPYEQQIAYHNDKTRREFQQALQHQQSVLAQQIDKNSWDGTTRGDPVRRQFSERVEALFQSELAAGRLPPPREMLFHYLYGIEADRLRRERSDTGRKQAGRRVAAQTTRPGGLRSDGGQPSRRPAGDSYEASLERVKGQPLW